MILCALVATELVQAQTNSVVVTPVPDEVRASFHLSPFYQKYVDAGGLPVVGSEKVSDYALAEAAFLVRQMMRHQPDVLAAIARQHVRLAVMAATEFTTDIPEHAGQEPKDYWDWRCRGQGASPERPAISCAEENLLDYPGDPYAAENILIHEFGHVIHQMGLNAVDPSFEPRLQETYDHAIEAGLWKGTYAGTNFREYWAEGVQDWFDCNDHDNFEHGKICTRAQVKEYDPELSKLLAEVFGDDEWRYQKPSRRQPPSPHLAGFDPANAPKFVWPPRLAEARARYRRGEITLAPADAVTLAPVASPHDSPDGGESTSIYFQNAGKQVCRIWWIDFDGQPQLYNTLRPTDNFVSQTYVGHVWQVTDEQGRTQGVYVATDKPGMVVLKEESVSPPGMNLAIFASASSSFVSGDTTVDALNDDAAPKNSRDNSHHSYGNWPKAGAQWVEYDWSKPVSTKQIEVYWWDDRRGVRLPQACRVKFWNGSDFALVTNVAVAGDKFNVAMFDEVQTSKLRLEIDSTGTFSTGVLEWKVIDSGKSPAFPPKVAAGVDRDVILGGKTYLSGTVKPAAKVTWSKACGTGEVTFADAHALETTATFSAPGRYELKLTAGEGELSSSSTLNVTVSLPPPAERLDVVYTKRYKVDSPLWNSRFKALIVNWIPHCIDYINRTDLTQGEGGIDNFVEAGKALRGEPHGKHKGYVFSNAWVHQTVEAMCLALMVDPQGDAEIIKAQEQMRATLEDWIPKILAAQEPDGYLQTAYTLADRNRWPEHWSPRHRGDHEGYVAGYFIESAINHYTLSGGKDKRLYDAAKKLADCWVANIGPGKKEWFDGHQEMEQALVRFGRFVNDVEGHGHGVRYIQLAKFLLDCRRRGGEYDQSHVPVQQQYEAVGHAVRAMYSYSGMADVAAETHDVDYESAVMSLWDNLVNRKYYVTGGIGSGETSEGFGPNYSLRNEAYCESCSSCGLIFFQYKMNLAYHDAKYADLYEETMYNALLGSLDSDGKNFYYDNPLIGGAPRYPWHACPCCVGNIPRTLLMIPTWTYVKGKDSLYVNLFIGSTIDVENVAGTDVQMVQKTDYPWSGNVSITVNPKRPRNFTIYVRVPNRTTSALYTPAPPVGGIKSLAVSGKSVTPKIENGYAVITREWHAGDKIDLALPMEIQRVNPDEKIAATRGSVALRYGPIIYNVEQADQPDINQPIGKAPLATEWRGDLLDGVLTIKGQWADGSPLLAIPNYARNNRTMIASGEEAASPKPNRGGRSGNSMVWIKDE